MTDASQPAKDLPSRLGKWMLLAAWVLALAVLALLFQRLMDEQYNPNRAPVLGLDETGRAQVVLERNHAGHYLTTGRINGQAVVFLIDTGATDVALPLPLARRLGLTLGEERIARTANGTVRTWTTRLDSVDVGGLTARDVRASVLPNMPGEEVLLGMSYLKRFELIQRDGRLTLRVPG
ncbi:MAG: TIGR02281 family clan AA aspartic protease [Chromatiaceae bacterium]|nr:TIGR02281 family clan AA aspartic protease [Chromatiaceae bacterium]